MKSIMAMALTAMGLLAAPPATSQELLDSYVAVIGVDDLYNSKGARLAEPWQVLRQDRANFHRFGIRQNGDQGDSFFGSKTNRAIMEQLVKNGHIDRQAARSMMAGNATVEVRIYGWGTAGQYLDVTVFD